MNAKCWTGFLAVVCAGTAWADTAVVQADRVNLRSRPVPNAEVVGQAAGQTVLTVKSVTNGWVEVQAPDTGCDVYVHRDFIKEGVVISDPLNIRAGPGINYSRVGALKKGDPVTARGEVGEWIRIAPPAAVSLWVKQDLVKMDTAPAAAPPALPTPPSPPATTASGTPGATPSAPSLTGPTRAPDTMETTPVNGAIPKNPALGDLKLAPVARQGLIVQREGRIYIPTLSFGRPSKFQFITGMDSGGELICYLKGNSEQLTDLEGRPMRIKGSEYWVQGSRQPVIVVEQIMLLPE